MFTADPTLDLVAFGLNVVDPDAADYRGWVVPPLQGCCNDAAAWAALGALAGLKSTAIVSTYSGQMSAVGNQVPPYRLVLDCTRQALRSQIAARAAFVKPGDLSIICISGHGAQEKYLMESIESLVLTDGLMPDYEFHNLLALFPAGARVAVFLDTCHSGGMDRAVSFRHRQKFAGKMMRTGQRAASAGKNVMQADVGIFSACPQDATALDGQYNGAFTGSLMSVASQIIQDRLRPDTREIFARTQVICQQQFRQSPVAKFFGDTSAWQRPFMR